MTRSQLLRAISEQLGRPVIFSSIRHGQKIGEIDRGQMMPDGWAIYTERHVAQAIAYFKKRQHRARLRTPASC